MIPIPLQVRSAFEARSAARPINLPEWRNRRAANPRASVLTLPRLHSTVPDWRSAEVLTPKLLRARTAFQAASASQPINAPRIEVAHAIALDDVALTILANRMTGRANPSNGGRTEIRTRGRLPSCGFQDRRIKPLCHPSNVVVIAAGVQPAASAFGARCSVTELRDQW